DHGHGEAFAAKIGSFGDMIGSKGFGCMLHVVEPGKKAFPYHVHHAIEELFIILEGEGAYRFGGESYPVRANDVLAAPTGGPEVAHQIINTGAQPLKYLGISANVDTEVVEYPDSGKFSVTSRFDWANPQAGGIRYVGRLDSVLDYWDGEE
ncbi:MAG: cupin domain-containing protein, partial [Hyphomicrobiales bacterium]|nr:cupin domain-containing protein [Hyphomicrobiales bacterium]